MRAWSVPLSMALLACDRPSAAPPRDAPVVAAATSSAPSVPAPSVVPPALASTSRAPARDRPPPVPSSLVAAPPRPIGGATFLSSAVDPDADPVWIARLASAPIVDLRWNGGGTSVTLRATFADGRRAVMKPAQTRSSSNHRGEIAAYHVDRLVGFGRTAVVVGRRVPRGLIEQATMSDSERARVEAEVARESTVEVAMIAWHDGPLVDDTPPRDALVAGPPLSPDLALRVAAWSDLHAFDFLIDNTDRWSGGNVLAKGKGGPLVFLDNASSFLPGRARAGSTMSKDLAPVCRFSAATVARLRALASVDSSLSAALRDSLAKDPLAPVLDDLTRQAIDTRLRSLITHVDECVRAHGEAAVVIR